MQEFLSREVVSQIRQIGGEKLLSELADLYLEHTPQRLERLEKGLQDGNLEQVAKAAHSIRSSSVSLGAQQVADKAAGVERKAESGAPEGLDEMVEELQEVTVALMTHLASKVERGET